MYKKKHSFLYKLNKVHWFNLLTKSPIPKIELTNFDSIMEKSNDNML